MCFKVHIVKIIGGKVSIESISKRVLDSDESDIIKDVARRHILDVIYAKIPSIDCKKLCAHSCGVILMSETEREIISKRIGHDVNEYILEELKNSKTPACANCPMLDIKSKTCTIYDIRPLICRLYGVVKKMRCPHGCKPKRWLKPYEAKKLLAEAQKWL